MSEHEHDMRRLLRLVSGELGDDAARRLRRRAADDPSLGRELDRLEGVWAALDGAPDAGVPPGFSGRVMARVREEAVGSPRLSWVAAPLWARAAGAVALIVGLAAGAGLGSGLTTNTAEGLEPIYDTAATSSSSLADDYADALTTFDAAGEGS